MSLVILLSAHAASPAEKVMHAVHEVVGWGVLAAVASVLVLGGVRTYIFSRKTDAEFAAILDRSSLLTTIAGLHRNYLGPMYRTLFVSGVVGFCSNMYRGLEVGMIDRFNYVAASSVRRFSELLYEYVDVKAIDGPNYFVANMTRKLSDLAFRYAELAGIDGLNYLVANSAVGLSSRFRKTHTGVHSYNMALVGMAFVVYLILLLYVGKLLG